MKEVMRRKRIKILKEINRLLTQCDCTDSRAKDCANCRKLKVLGTKLLKLVNKRVVDRKYSERKERKPELPITKQQYILLKKENVLDKEIAEMCNVSAFTLKKWKSKNNIKMRVNARAK